MRLNSLISCPLILTFSRREKDPTVFVDRLLVSQDFLPTGPTGFAIKREAGTCGSYRTGAH